MKTLFFVISFFAFSYSFSQKIIEALESTLTNSVGNAHSEMKNLGLKLDLVFDKDKFVSFIYSSEENVLSFSSGSIIIKEDFNEVILFSVKSSKKEMTELAMKEIESKKYIYKKIKEGGEIIYSNGVYELGFKTESFTIGNYEYRVSITKINIQP
jgi:hypothetical protein